jgi:orotate phosphoribosyltransferase
MLEETIQSSGIIDLMKQSGALLSGHFELASGLHSSQYIQCALLLEDPVRSGRVGAELARLIGQEAPGPAPQVVISPAVGGLIIGHEVARALGARSIFAERVQGKMTLRRGFTIAEGESAVVVEDVFTTGGSIKEVMDVVADRGGQVTAVGSVVDRGTDVDFGVPTAFLVKARIENYDPADCPMCKQGIEVVKPGSKRLQMGAGGK